MKPFLCVFLPLLLAYATALLWCADRWNAPTEYFTHCWLVPFVGAMVVWFRRRMRLPQGESMQRSVRS